MKYLKTYKKLNKKPKIGNYVICHDNFFNTFNITKYDIKKYHDFLINNIGQIIGKEKDGDRFIIKYNNIPTIIKPFFQKNNTSYFDENEIKYISKNKSDLKIYMSAKKYNL